MTAQIPDSLVYKGNSHHIYSEPLYLYLEENDIDIKGTCSACWRGYVARWEIEDNKLYLVHLKGNLFKEDSSLGLDDLFPGQKKVFAEWFSGEIKVLDGEMIQYVHSPYASVFERYILLDFENGVLISEKTISYEDDEISMYYLEEEKKCEESDDSWIEKEELEWFDENAGTPKMKKLKQDHMSLTSLDLSQYISLEKLNCNMNNLTSLDISNNTALTEVQCCRNNLTSLDISNNLALEDLNCFTNAITSLDVSKNTKLKSLCCSRNYITSLDLKQNIALESLYCSENDLTMLDVSQNIALKQIVCNHNNLTSLDLSKNKSLENLSAHHNMLTSVKINPNAPISSIKIDHNQLSDDALNELFHSLPKINGRYIIHMENNPGSDTCDAKIAFQKGWDLGEFNGVMRASSPEELIQGGFQILNSYTGDLNGDGIDDRVVISMRPADKTYVLLYCISIMFFDGNQYQLALSHTIHNEPSIEIKDSNLILSIDFAKKRYQKDTFKFIDGHFVRIASYVEERKNGILSEITRTDCLTKKIYVQKYDWKKYNGKDVILKEYTKTIREEELENLEEIIDYDLY